MNLEIIKQNFLEAAEKTKDFEQSIAQVAQQMNGIAPNAENFQLIFDSLYWYWSENFPPLHPDKLDRIALKYSRFGEYQEAIIKQQIRSADEYREALEANDISPLEGLSLAVKEAHFMAEREGAKKAIAQSPSAIALPQAVVNLYRAFYRANKKYQPTVTAVLKPLYLAKEVISKSHSNGEDLKQEVLGRLCAFMRQVRNKTAQGRWVIPNTTLEMQAIADFADFMVYHVLNEKFRGDRSQFSSQTGIGLIEDACWAIYLLQEEKEQFPID